MKRKDLVHGTVFCYGNHHLVRATFAVGNIQLPGAPPAALREHIPHLDADVLVVWSPIANWTVEYRASATAPWKQVRGKMTEAQAKEEAYFLNRCHRGYEYRASPLQAEAAPPTSAKSPWSCGYPPVRKLELHVDPHRSMRPQLEALSDEDIDKLAEAAAEKTRRDLRKKEAAESRAREDRQRYLASRKGQEDLTKFCNFMAGVTMAMAARIVLRWYAGHVPQGRVAQHGAPWQYWEISDAAMDLYRTFAIKAPWMARLDHSGQTGAMASTLGSISRLPQRRRPDGAARSWGVKY